jgi:hypothetical protein
MMCLLSDCSVQRLAVVFNPLSPSVQDNRPLSKGSERTNPESKVVGQHGDAPPPDLLPETSVPPLPSETRLVNP